MKSEIEIAEFIMNLFFERNLNANNIISWGEFQNSYINLNFNSEEHSLFEFVLNKLIENEYIIYETAPVKCIRLTLKGYNYIHGEKTLNF